MNEIKIFNSPQFGDIRTAGTPEQPLFCLADVCKVLNLRTDKVASRLEDGDLSKVVITDNLGREQQANFITENGLYDAILDSRKPSAKQFRKWVTGEVLPAIRKRGGYMVAIENETPEETMARALLIANDTITRQKEMIAERDKRISELEPKARLMTKVMSSETVYTTTQVANQLGMTANELNKKLQECGIIYLQSGQWLLHAPYVRLGLHATRFVPITASDGSSRTNAYTVWMQRGCLFLQNLQRSNWNTRKTLRDFESYCYKPSDQ